MSGDILSRVWENLVGRLGGPLSLRFVLQPAMGAILAIRDGVRDARTSQTPYAWSLFTDKVNRMRRVRDGWKSVAKIFVIAALLDGIYQIIVFHTFYPGETLIVAFILAIVPYVLLRGPVNRFVRWRKRSTRDLRRAA